MKQSSGLNQLLNLANILLFPSVWLKWLLLAGITLAGIGSPFVVALDSVVFIIMAICGGMFICVSTFIMLLVLPGQMLAVNSSKIISILPRVRRLSLILLFLFCFIFSLVVTSLIVFLSKSSIFLHTFFSIFLIISFLVTCNLLVVMRWRRAQFAVFLLILAIPTALIWVQSINIIFGLILNSMLWIGFAVWWSLWRPKIFFENSIGMTRSQTLAMQESDKYKSKQGMMINNIFFGLHYLEKPLTTRMCAIKTHLTGANLDWLGYVQRSILIMVLMGVLMFFLYLSKGIQPTVLILSEKLFFFIFLVYFSCGQPMLGTSLRNLNRIWLICQSSRSAILNLIERNYFSSVTAGVLPVFAIHSVLCFTFPDIFLDPLFAFILFAFCLQHILIMFYLDILIYVHPRFGFEWMSFVNLIIAALSLSIIYVVKVFWLSSKDQMIFYAVVTLIASFVGALFLRMKVIRIWPKVNFLRPAN